jgi:hypothetical protein
VLSEAVSLSPQFPNRLSRSESALCDKVVSIEASLCYSSEVSLYCVEVSNASSEAIESAPKDTADLMG